MTPSSSHTPCLSAIVCTRNSKDRIVDTLVSLQNQSLSIEDYEVLVVDNSSDDGTDLWLKENADHFVVWTG